MAVLGRAELDAGIKAGRYIKNPHIVNGEYCDLQSASYDLTAGVAVWRESGKAGAEGVTREERIVERTGIQPTVDLQPGQMMSIITHEELNLPADVCGTVYSKNTIALKGIFAFNAGHVDPGYNGPIIIRLLSLRRTKLTLTMGQPVFLIVFEKLGQAADITASPSLTHEKALLSVREFSNDALSNALFELYAKAIEDRLDDHKNSVLEKVRGEFDQKFVQKDNLSFHIWVAIGIAVGASIALAAALVNIVTRWPDVLKVIRGGN